MLVLHKLHRDGSIEHENFASRDQWERALVDPDVVLRWAHVPGDCEHPAEKVRRAFRGEDYSINEVAHELTRMGMPDLAGDSKKIVFGANKDRILEQVKREHKPRRFDQKPKQGSLF